MLIAGTIRYPVLATIGTIVGDFSPQMASVLAKYILEPRQTRLEMLSATLTRPSNATLKALAGTLSVLLAFGSERALGAQRLGPPMVDNSDWEVFSRAHPLEEIRLKRSRMRSKQIEREDSQFCADSSSPLPFVLPNRFT